MKTDLNGVWSDRLIEIFTPNALEFHFGQQLLHDDLQWLDCDLGDMHTPYPNIQWDMEFTKVLIVKQKLEGKNLQSETELITSVWTLKTNTCWPLSFL
jgi:hypothetical protein